MANRINLGAVKGETGATGAQGLTGATGQDGKTPEIINGYWFIGGVSQNVKAKGDTWYRGTGAPTDQGVNGDYYIDTATNDVYNKQNNVWSLATNIQGEKGDTGEQGENATSIEIGTVTTLPNGEQATAELVPLGNGAYQLNLAIPEGVQGERGEQGVNGNTTAYVGGLAVNTLVFSSDPQTQIDNKLNSNLGSSNAGKMLIVGADGSITPATSSAEDDVIDAYITEGIEYSDEWLSLTAGGQPLTPAMGKIYLIRSSGDYYLLQFAWNGTAYEQTGGGDTSELATKSEAVGSIALTIDSSTYVVTLQAKNVNGTNIGTAQTIDLPLESVVVDVDYDAQTKELILTLQNGNSTRVDVSDIVNGLQQEITANNKLSADLVDDTNSTNKFTNATEKATWNAKQDNLGITAQDIQSAVTQIATNTQSISQLSSTKQDIITPQAPLSTEALSDVGSSNKFVTASEKAEWSNTTSLVSGILNGQNLDSFADVETEFENFTPSLPSNTATTDGTQVFTGVNTFYGNTALTNTLVNGVVGYGTASTLPSGLTSKLTFDAYGVGYGEAQGSYKFRDVISSSSLTEQEIGTTFDGFTYIYTGETNSSQLKNHIYQLRRINETTTGWYDITPNTPYASSNVSASSWVSDNTYADYGYKCVLNFNITTDDYVEVIYGVEEATSGNYAPIAETGNGTLTLYSKVDTAITIPTIWVVKK